jgi:potassium efflux system protein
MVFGSSAFGPVRAGSLLLALVSAFVLARPAVATAQEADAAATPAPAGAEVEAEAEIARLATLAEEWAARSLEFARSRESAPDVLAAIDAEIAELERSESPPIDPDLPLAEVETELLGVEQDLALAQREAATLEAEAAGRSERRKQIPDLLSAAKARLLAFDGESAPAAAEPGLAELRQRVVQARRTAVEREIEAYDAELRSYEARGQLLARRSARTALRITALEARNTALREAFAARRQGEAEVAAEEAERLLESAGAMPAAVLAAVQSLAEENRELAIRRTGDDGLLQRIEDTRGKRARAEAQVADLTSELEFLQRHVEVGGLSGAVGMVLRKARSDAPEIGKYRRFIRMRRDRIAEVQLQQVALLEQRQALKNVEKSVAETMAEFDSVLAPEDRAAVESLLRHLFETRRRYFDALIADTETYFEQLVDFDARQRELVSRTESLHRFIDERVLWIPSGKPLPRAPKRDVWDALAWLFDPRFWGQLLRALGATFAREPVTAAAVVLLLFGPPLAWPRIRGRIAALGARAAEPSCIRFEPTGVALGLSLLLAAWAPGLLAISSWRLGVSIDATQFVRCFAHGLGVAAFVWVTLVVPRQLMRPDGIAVAHLGWPAKPTQRLRRQLGWLASVAVPAVFVAGVFELRGEEAWTESVGRIAFLVILAAIGVFNHSVLRERGGVLSRLFEARSALAPPTWARRLLHVAGVLMPLALAVAVVRGYYWTGYQLVASLHLTLVFLLLLVFMQQLGARWFLVASRRLALKRWQAAEIARAEKKAADPEAPDPEPVLEESEVALATVDEHTHRILRNAAVFAALVGVWMIWADLFPATGLLDTVDLWETTTTATVEMTNAAGERIASVEERLVPVTLADLLLALLIAAATLAVVRNLPGLLEVSIFRQLQTSAGERYAYATIATYAVMVVGAAAALNAVGVGWASVQWLVAAVGLGLGFGLQEIFANFVSGLIILFERPIRVGDTVTVGEVSGTVSKIRIRATWITGFDRKELVVPNKEFITNRLVNWSLSDAVLRVEIPVGIAYGSDTAKAERVLREVAERNEHVLDDPAPYALFRGFGASSLDFELRAFSPDVSRYLQIVHELHMEIDQAFRAEGIEIAFPQRDLHLRSLPVSPADSDPAAAPPG